MFVIFLYTSVLLSTNKCFLQLWSSNHDCFLYTQLHTWLTEFLLLVTCFVLLFYNPFYILSSRTFVFSLSRELYCNFIVFCVHIVVCAFAYLSILFLLLAEVGWRGTCSMYLLVCICSVFNDIILFLFS